MEAFTDMTKRVETFELVESVLWRHKIELMSPPVSVIGIYLTYLWTRLKSEIEETMSAGDDITQILLSIASTQALTTQIFKMLAGQLGKMLNIISLIWNQIA